MRVFIFKYSVPLVYALASAVLALLLATTLLYTQKANVQTLNRTLILQNDSILSENIQLKHSLSQEATQRPRKKNALSVNYP